MAEIKLHNSKTRKKEVFAPIDPDNVRMYVCGPTVYDRAHLGNARPVVVFDTLYRLLRHTYGEDHVTYVRNFTDVDDKINKRAADSGRSIREITDETIQWYLEDMAELVTLPLKREHMPRATEYVPQMVAMIEDLISRDHAYAAEGHVLFAVESYKNYGALSGRSIDDMIAGARVEIAPYKRNPMDFVLWKPSSGDQPGWESPWGFGRPGWHIECSAMSYELLGANFDIHGGGNDLQFPHHENEIAQSRCAHPESEFANVWMHNEMLQVESKKMSKSLGNFFTVRDLLEQGVPGEVMRFVFLSTHYRKPMDWTEKKAQEAETTLRKWYSQVDHAPDNGNPSGSAINALNDDLNTHGALAECYRLSSASDAASLRATMRFIGLMNQSIPDWAVAKGPSEDVSALIETLIIARVSARQQKNFAKSDAIRGLMQIAGVNINDGQPNEWSIENLDNPLGWLAISAPAFDGHTVITFSELECLAEERDIEIRTDESGRWVGVSTSGSSSGPDLKILKLAQNEALK